MIKMMWISVFLLLSSSVSDQLVAQTVSYIPSEGVEQFIVERLDLTTFRNSLGPLRSAGMRHFSDMGLVPTEISEGRMVFETGSWYYSLEILDRRDVNGDGLEDLLIRFTDDSIEGTYLTVYVYLMTCLSEGSDLIAIAYGPPAEFYAERDPGMVGGIVIPPSEQGSTEH